MINATLALTVNCHKDRWKSMLQMYLHKDLFVTRPNAAPVWRSGRARAGCAPRTPTAGSSGTAGAARVERYSEGCYDVLLPCSGFTRAGGRAMTSDRSDGGRSVRG